MQVFHNIDSYREWRNSLPATAKVGFVPTMGALHAGHAKLLEVSAKENNFTVLSIYVNPTQFGPNEDLSKYPRTLESDLKIAEKEGVSAVFVPTNEVLYPEGYSTYVNEEHVSQPLCGIYRPGHFRGVATIVLKLFNIIAPSNAYFGLKDAQQFLVIERMVMDLNVPVKLTGVPTVREASGLALSSRNVYLAEKDRIEKAPIIYQTLTETMTGIQAGKEVQALVDQAKVKLKAAGFDVQYLEFMDLSPRRLLAIAAFYPTPNGGSVRLIDNILI